MTIKQFDKTETRVAVLIPCHNEELTVAAVVNGFKQSMPHAIIYVYDNNSTDRTVELAIAAGAVVRSERRQGKGRVVRRMFADIDADIYVMVDGDATYDPAVAPTLVSMVSSGSDMVNVARVSTGRDAYRRGHRFGNWFLTSLVGWFFGTETKDMLSGYKAFSRRFVKTFPAVTAGFEIETELMIHALELKVSITEMEAFYGERPSGSLSKLSTFKDAARILRVIAFFVKNERPIPFFTAIASILAIASLSLGIPVMIEFMDTGLVPRVPTALLAAAIGMVSALSFFTGLVLDAVTLSRREAKRIAYLQIKSAT